MPRCFGPRCRIMLDSFAYGRQLTDTLLDSMISGRRSASRIIVRSTFSLVVGAATSAELTNSDSRARKTADDHI